MIDPKFDVEGVVIEVDEHLATSHKQSSERCLAVGHECQVGGGDSLFAEIAENFVSDLGGEAEESGLRLAPIAGAGNGQYECMMQVAER